MSPSPTEILATVLFTLAVLHTFCVKRFAHWAHRYPSGSIQENLLHFLAETEVVFGLWGAALFLGIASLQGSMHHAVEYVEGLNFTEPKFVFVIMVVAATRPVVRLGGRAFASGDHSDGADLAERSRDVAVGAFPTRTAQSRGAQASRRAQAGVRNSQIGRASCRERV
jgi:hypothetical protein